MIFNIFVFIFLVIMNFDIYNFQSSRSLNCLRNQFVQRKILHRQINSLSSVFWYLKSKYENWSRVRIGNEKSIFMLTLIKRTMNVCRSDSGITCKTINLQFFISDNIQEGKEIWIAEIKVKMIEEDFARSRKRIIIVVDEHKNISGNRCVIYSFSFTLIGTESKRFVRDDWSYIKIDMTTHLTKRNNVLIDTSDS